MLCRVAAKVAVTVAAPETAQVLPFVEVHPLQPTKVKPVPAWAVRLTDPLNVAMQVPEFVPNPVAEQLIPAGLLVTLPLPLPALTTVISPGVPPWTPLTRP